MEIKKISCGITQALRSVYHMIKAINRWRKRLIVAMLLVIVCICIFIWCNPLSNFIIFLHMPLCIASIAIIIFLLFVHPHIKEYIVLFAVLLIIFIWSFSGVYYINKMTNDADVKQDATASPVCQNLETLSDKRINLNELGDAFGAMNALFAGLGVAGIIYTIILQSIEIKKTQDELDSQNATSVMASFDNSFFNMLEAHRAILKRTDEFVQKYIGDDYARHYLGTNQHDMKITCFEFLKIKFIDDIRKREIKNNFLNLNEISYPYSESIKKNLFDRIDRIYPIFNRLLQSGIYDSYFRMTYRILKYIDEYDFSLVVKENIKKINLDSNTKHEFNIENTNGKNNLKDEEDKIRRQYVGILRAQLSVYEQIALFYNCLNPDYSKAKNLIQKYSLFNSIRPEQLLDKSDLFLYNIKAYGKEFLSWDKLDQENFCKYFFRDPPRDEKSVKLQEVYKIWSEEELYPEPKNEHFIPGILGSRIEGKESA